MIVGFDHASIILAPDLIAQLHSQGVGSGTTVDVLRGHRRRHWPPGSEVLTMTNHSQAVFPLQ